MNYKVDRLNVEVEDKVLEEINNSMDKQFIRVKDRLIPLEQIIGDYELDTDDITLAHLGWLCKYREVLYAFRRKGKLSIGVLPR